MNTFGMLWFFSLYEYEYIYNTTSYEYITYKFNYINIIIIMCNEHETNMRLHRNVALRLEEETIPGLYSEFYISSSRVHIFTCL